MCYVGIVNLLDQYFNVMYKLKVSYDLQYFLLPNGVTQKQTENRTRRVKSVTNVQHTTA